MLRRAKGYSFVVYATVECLPGFGRRPCSREITRKKLLLLPHSRPMSPDVRTSSGLSAIWRLCRIARQSADRDSPHKSKLPATPRTPACDSIIANYERIARHYPYNIYTRYNLFYEIFNTLPNVRFSLAREFPPPNCFYIRVLYTHYY